VEFLSISVREEDGLICPLAVGGHVDHRLARQAAERLGRRMRYYADLPYVLQSPGAAELLAAQMEAEVHRVSRRGLQAWMEAAAAYETQAGSFWPSPSVMQEQITAYAASGVRLWSMANRG